MPNFWQPNCISQITSRSWKKHQKLGQDLTSLFSVLQNEPLGESWPGPQRGNLRKACGEKGPVEAVTRYWPTFAGSVMAGVSHTLTPGLHLPAREMNLVQRGEEAVEGMEV